MDTTTLSTLSVTQLYSTCTTLAGSLLDLLCEGRLTVWLWWLGCGAYRLSMGSLATWTAAWPLPTAGLKQPCVFWQQQGSIFLDCCWSLSIYSWHFICIQTHTQCILLRLTWDLFTSQLWLAGWHFGSHTAIKAPYSLKQCKVCSLNTTLAG